ncbi:hypothetical protein [Actinomycetospora termitidis]|uniref:Uncharacterized protein n=1 Tax=Actinomycetospora termitidis TaxID=3053470 RepID=A0ABT7M5Z9_9PSEU|nr:hypothetical protein [Actinomycetospora sp. Odt1-22]MDL5155222.1 hypothetical protein [Actinomycetospora sp. Odt1-22]
MTMTTHDAPTPYRPAQSEAYTVTAVLLLVAGGFVVPVVGWFAGVVMLWAGPRWSAADKWLGTLVWPAVVVVPLAAGLATAAAVGRDLGPGVLAGGIVGAITVLVGLPWAFVHLLRAAR